MNNKAEEIANAVKDIFFLNENSLNTWVDKIVSLYNNDNELSMISKNSIKIIFLRCFTFIQKI